MESDEAEEWDEIVLVPDGSEASNSLLIRGTLEPVGIKSLFKVTVAKVRVTVVKKNLVLDEILMVLLHLMDVHVRL
ncbi:hypothetical protein Tco_1008080 [Tanacetum coccineum]